MLTKKYDLTLKFTFILHYIYILGVVILTLEPLTTFCPLCVLYSLIFDVTVPCVISCLACPVAY